MFRDMLRHKVSEKAKKFLKGQNITLDTPLTDAQRVEFQGGVSHSFSISSGYWAQELLQIAYAKLPGCCNLHIGRKEVKVRIHPEVPELLESYRNQAKLCKETSASDLKRVLEEIRARQLSPADDSWIEDSLDVDFAGQNHQLGISIFAEVKSNDNHDTDKVPGYLTKAIRTWGGLIHLHALPDLQFGIVIFSWRGGSKNNDRASMYVPDNYIYFAEDLPKFAPGLDVNQLMDSLDNAKSRAAEVLLPFSRQVLRETPITVGEILEFVGVPAEDCMTPRKKRKKATAPYVQAIVSSVEIKPFDPTYAYVNGELYIHPTTKQVVKYIRRGA